MPVDFAMVLGFMRWRFELKSMVLAAFLTSWGGANAQAPIATPAIDESLFREGAVQARQFDSGHWHANCREIVKIKKRICNLLGEMPSDGSVANGSILIATTDNGVPAVMIAIPPEVSRKRPISIKASNIGKVDGRVVKVEYSNVANLTECDTTCKYMFPLDPRLVFALNAGESAAVYVPGEETHQKVVSKKPNKEEKPVYTIPGEGFAEALKASTQGW